MLCICQHCTVRIHTASKRLFLGKTLDENVSVLLTPKSSNTAFVPNILYLTVFTQKNPINTLSPGTGPTVGPVLVLFSLRQNRGWARRKRRQPDIRRRLQCLRGEAKTAPVLLLLYGHPTPTRCTVKLQHAQAKYASGVNGRDVDSVSLTQRKGCAQGCANTDW